VSFKEWNLIYYSLIVFILFITLYKRFEKKSVSWISKYFFKEPTNIYKLKNIFLYLGIGLMLLAALDLRGPEESVKVEMRTQKTVVLIDVSASMAVEDIRPNRFEKALMVAMHFVKKSVGHKIAVFIFSNETKQVVPFTDDIDHINARIEALNQYRTLSGTSNLSLAINEVSNYFKGEGEEGGNILVFTDGEEHSKSMKTELDDSISLGIVGIGTAKGGRIPIRDNYNILRGHKKFNGNEVVSKLNEEFLKSSFSDVENYNYWIVSGYAIPTDQILNFFKSSFVKKQKEGIQRVSPVYANLLMVPACLFVLLSYLLGHFRLVKGVTTIALAFFISFKTFPQPENEEQKVKLSETEQREFDELIEKHKKGRLSKGEEKYLAGKFLKQKEFGKAAAVYEDAISFPEHENLDTLMNYGTSLIGSQKLSKGVDMLELALSKVRDDDEETKEQIKQNILLALKQEEQRKKQKKNKDKNKKKDKKDKNKNQDNKDGDKKKDDKKNKDNKEEKNNEKKEGDGDKNEEEKKKKEGKVERKKMSALMKEILNDDKKLQKKLLDTSRGKKKGGASDKDW
jgi:Ca-activated chloride channel family protein